MKTFTIFVLSTVFLLITLNQECLSHDTLESSKIFPWSEILEGDFELKGERKIVPSKYRIIKANFAELQKLLSSAPYENTDRAESFELEIELPLPDGGFSKFIVTEYSVMEKGLEAKFPDIKTYNVKGIDDPFAVGKIDITMHGFHAMILSPGGDFFIDPYSTNEKEIYISYYKNDLINFHNFKCEFDSQVRQDSKIPLVEGKLFCGPQLRTYRLACAATGEYTVFHGGTIAAGLSAVVVAINRMNTVYENEFAVRMILVANNNLIIYTNPSVDPYTNNNGGAMLSQNQSNLDNIIGDANYDFGHVFSTGGGGVAYLRSICVSGIKAQGVTGLPTPIGDPFYIDYVAHEMGHQFGGNHSFNSVTSGCGGGNRNPFTAWEPGSGSTIMSYAGLCGSSNLQFNSDDYFHSGNFTEIAIFTQLGVGSVCPAITNTGNTPPSVTVPSGGFTIPISTPFQLTGSATDLENPNSLTYCWEEMDLGPAGPPNSPSGSAPIFRTFKPDTMSTRIFPKLTNIINNTQTIGELLPTYTRGLSFRLTVRDNNSGGGGVNYEFMQFNVTDSAGPFKVTQPDSNVSWNSNLPQIVTWNVAKTDTTSVNCQSVNIKLSTNGGLNYQVTLVSNTPNDGSQIVDLLSINSVQARIKVEAADNIFFDISNVNFALSNLVSVNSIDTEVPVDFFLAQNFPNPFNPETIINYSVPELSKVKLTIYDALGKEVNTLLNTSQNAGQYKINWDGKDFLGIDVPSGVYFYNLNAGNSFNQTKKMFLVR